MECHKTEQGCLFLGQPTVSRTRLVELVLFSTAPARPIRRVKLLASSLPEF